MSVSVAAVECRRGAAERLCPLWARSLLGIAGSLFALTGIAMTITGLFAAPDRSTYYLLAGTGLIVSGVLFAKRRTAGVWAYAGVFAATLTWSLRGAGLGGSSLLYRMVGPLIMLSMICGLMPLLGGWSRSRTVRRCTALMIGTMALGILAGSTGTHRGIAPSKPPVAAVQQ